METEIAYAFFTRDSSGAKAAADATPTAVVSIDGTPVADVPTIVPAAGTGQYSLTLLIDVEAGQLITITADATVAASPWSDERVFAIADYASLAAALADELSAYELVDDGPVTPTGEIKPLTRGDDYLAEHGRQIKWTRSLPGVDTTGATCWFGAAAGAESWLVQGAVSHDGDNVTISFDLPSASTINLTPGHYQWTAELRSSNGKRLTQLRGSVILEDSQTIPSAP